MTHALQYPTHYIRGDIRRQLFAAINNLAVENRVLIVRLLQKRPNNHPALTNNTTDIGRFRQRKKSIFSRNIDEG